MRKILSKIAGLALGLSLAAGVGVSLASHKASEVRADSVTFAASDFNGQGTSGSGSEMTLTKSGVTVTVAAGFKGSSAYAQSYAGSSITFSAGSSVSSIDGFTITANGTNYNGSQSSGTMSVNDANGTLTRSASSVDIVYSGAGVSSVTLSHNKQIRISSISVSYTTGSTPVTNYTISYDANGGSGEMEDTVGENPEVAECEFTAPSGKVFSKWNTAADGSGTDYSVGTKVTKDLPLFAIWVDKPTCVTLDKIGTSLGSTANTTEETVAISDGSDSYTLNYYQCKKQGDSMFLTKSVSPYISNHTEMPGSITSVQLFINTGASGDTTYDVAFGTTEYHTATAGVGAVNIGSGGNHLFENASVSNARYFCVTLGNAKNGQVLKIVVNYESSSSSLKNMVIKQSGAAADGASFNWKSTGTYTFVAYDEETQLTNVSWSVNNSEVAEINASTGSLTTVATGQVTVTAQVEGYNNATASITITKGTLQSITVSGAMSKTAYTTNDTAWSSAGLVATGTYSTGWQETLSDVNWTFTPSVPAEGITSVVARATVGSVSNVSEAQSVTVSVAHAGTSVDPFTVAEGIAKCQEIGTTASGDWYVKGIISAVTSTVSDATTYGNATFNMSDDGENETFLIAYQVKYVGGVAFTETTFAELKVGCLVVVHGALLNYKGTTPEFNGKGASSLASIEQPASGDIEVTFEQSTTAFEIGATGTFSASSTTEGVSYTWVSNHPEILSVNESTGAYEALALGSARITVTGSANNKEGTAFVDFTVNGTQAGALTVSEANAIASSVASGKTTAYYVYVKGYVKEFGTSMSGTSPRAFDICDLAEANRIMVYTNVNPYSEFINGLSLGDYIVVKANIQNYSGTFELTLPEKISSATSAMSFAFSFLEGTDAVCEGYKVGDDNSTALGNIWDGFETSYNALSEAEQAHLINTEGCGETILGAMARYDHLIKVYPSLEAFVTNRVSNGSNVGYGIGNSIDSNSSTIIIVVVALTSITSIGVLLVIKRRRSLVK